MSGDGAFLSRWSKRKREARTQPPDEAGAPKSECDTARIERAEKTEEEPFDLSLLPDLETLTGESDIQSFLHKAVPDALRNAALRKVWALDPAVRNYIGEALDYAYDWNTLGGVPGFGEILSDEQSMAFVRNLLAGPDTDEKLIEEPATRQDHAPPLDADPIIGQQKSETPAEDIQSIEKVDFIETGDVIGEQSAAKSQPPRKARHGGALPL